MTYRKQDLGKMILLSVLIVAAVGFSLYTVRGAHHARGAPAPPRAAAAQSKTAELFAARSNATAGLVARALAANDPFRPSASARTRPGQAPVAPRTSPRLVPRFGAQSAALRQEPAFRLFGLVMGTAPVAGIEHAQERYFARSGDTLPDGWRVAQIWTNRVTLTKGRERVTLRMAALEEGGTRPLGMR